MKLIFGDNSDDTDSIEFKTKKIKDWFVRYDLLDDARAGGYMMPLSAIKSAHDKVLVGKELTPLSVTENLYMSNDCDVHEISGVSFVEGALEKLSMTPTAWINEIVDIEKKITAETGMNMHESRLTYTRHRAALNQEELDQYVRLSKAYRGGPNIPFEIQLSAYDKEGEAPYGIELDPEYLDGIDIIGFLRIMIPLRERKREYGVMKGVDDPEKNLEVKQRAVVIYTRCALEQAEAEVNGNTGIRLVYFPTPAGAKLGKNGYISLFPDYPDSPVGMFRGEGAAFNAIECIEFISKHFPDVEDEILSSLADA